MTMAGIVMRVVFLLTPVHCAAALLCMLRLFAHTHSAAHWSHFHSCCHACSRAAALGGLRDALAQTQVSLAQAQVGFDAGGLRHIWA